MTTQIEHIAISYVMRHNQIRMNPNNENHFSNSRSQSESETQMGCQAREGEKEWK